MKMNEKEKRNLVYYKNQLNLVPMRNFNPMEMNLFYSICARLRDKGGNEVLFTFPELKHMSKYKTTAKERFADDIQSMYKKMLSLQLHHKDTERRVGFVLFTAYDINIKDETVKIAINAELEYILNELTREFTKFELEEFTEIKSTYAKTAYRFLKQYRKTGYAYFTMSDFRELFCIPKSYKMSDINKTVLRPIQNELSKYFNNLRINKLRGAGERRRFIDKLEFVFDSQTDVNESGYKTFRGDYGEYYEKHLYEFNSKEIEREFKPFPSPIGTHQYTPNDNYDVMSQKQKEDNEIKKNVFKKIDEINAKLSNNPDSQEFVNLLELRSQLYKSIENL